MPIFTAPDSSGNFLLDRLVVRIGAVLGWVLVVGGVVLWQQGDIEDGRRLIPTLLTAAIFTFYWVRRSERLFTALMTMVGVSILGALVNGAEEPFLPTAAAILVGSILAAAFVEQREAAYVVGGVVVLAVLPFVWGDSTAVSPALMSFTMSVFFAFGASLLVARGRLRRSLLGQYEALFRDAPTGMMEQDWSGVDAILSGHESEEALRQALLDDDELFTRAVGAITVVRVNRAMAEIAEVGSEADLLGGVHSSWLTPGFRPSLVEQLVAYMSQRHCRMVFETRSARNRPLWLEVRVNPQQREQRGRVLVLIDDITASKAEEAALEAEVAAKDQFIASVSHELRTPLTVVLGSLEELGSDRLDDSMIGELVGMATSQAREMSYIVEDLLVEARTGIGGVSIHLEPVDMVRTVHAVVRDLGVDIPVEAGDGDALFVTGDGVRVRQILRNLVLNAYRYGGTDRRVLLLDLGESARVEIRDSGNALPESIARKIFEPYQRGHQTNGSPSSIGLGLAVSRQLAGLMGGDVGYDHDGESVFSLVLPKWSEADPTRTDVAETPATEGTLT